MVHYLEKYLLEQRDRLPEIYRDRFMLHVKSAWAHDDMIYGAGRIGAEEKLERLAFFPVDEIIKWFEGSGNLEWTPEIESRKNAILGGYYDEYEKYKDKFESFRAVGPVQLAFYQNMGYQEVCSFDTPIVKMKAFLIAMPKNKEKKCE